MLHSYPWYFLSWRGSRTRARMTIEQRGLFREVLDLLYEDGGVPDDPDDIRRTVGATEEEWARSWPAVRATLAQTETGTLTHHKVREQLPELIRLKESRKQASSTAARARWAKALEQAGLPHASGIRDASERQCVDDAPKCPASASASASDKHSADADVEFALNHPAERQPSSGWKQEAFERFWSVVWARIGKGKARDAFAKAARTPRGAEQIIASARDQGQRLVDDARRQGRSVIHPATWLNQERWSDETPAAVREPGYLPEWKGIPDAD